MDRDDERFERPGDADGDEEARFAREDPEPEPRAGHGPPPEDRPGPRVSVVRETGDPHDDEYRWHTGLNRPTGAADAVEFIDVHKAFGRNKILRGLNMGIPEDKI